MISAAERMQIRRLTGRDRWIAIAGSEEAWVGWDNAEDLISAASIVGVDHRSLVSAAFECVEGALPRGAIVKVYERERWLFRTTKDWLNGEDVNINSLFMLSGPSSQNNAPNSYSEAIIYVARAAALAAEGYESIALEVSRAVNSASSAAAGAYADRERNEAQAKFAKYITREPDGPLRWEVIDAAKGAR